MKWFFSLIVVLVVGFVWLVIAMVDAEAEAVAYIESHDCVLAQRVEGYYTTIYMQVGQVMVPNMIWNPPRGRFDCTSGESRWVYVE